MDIQRWLNETAEAEPLPDPIHKPASGSLYCAETVPPVFKRQRARKGTKSDSSLLDPRPHSHTALKEPKFLSGQRSDESACSEASRSSRKSSTNNKSSQPYARRPRRKTRPERYQPKQPKERGQHVHRSRKDKPKRLNRKSKGKKDEKPDSSVAQTFDANNAPRDRLTLKPRESLGIFNKGRASTAVRGRGLPDLVFSEMKFLQKEKKHPDPEPQQSEAKKKRKRYHAHDKEGEISAFFTSARPPLAEKDSNITTLHASYRKRESSIKSSGVVPTTEVPVKRSYLGSGSRGPRQESTSYVSWSDSVHAPDTAISRPKSPPAIDHDQSRHFKHHRAKSTNGGAITTDYNKPTPPSLNDKRGGTSTECFRTSLVLSEQRMSRSHPYPQPTSSPWKVNLVDRAAKFDPSGSAASPSSMPPHAQVRTNLEPPCLELRAGSRLEEHDEIASSAVETSLSHQQDHTRTEAVMHMVDDGTSSDLGRVIQECNHVFREQRRTTEPHERRQTCGPRDSRMVSPVEVSHRPSVRFAGVEMRSPRVPNFPGASIYERQAQREQAPLQTVLDEEYSLERSYLDEHELAYPYDDMANDEQNWDEHFEGPWSDGDDPGVAMAFEPHACVNMSHESRPQNMVVAPRFWRPNRLY